MPTQQKIDRVEDIADRLKRSSIALTTNYSGISVNEMTELRRAMRGGGVDFTIVKNTLLALAADEANKPGLKEIVEEVEAGHEHVIPVLGGPIGCAEVQPGRGRRRAESDGIRWIVKGI